MRGCHSKLGVEFAASFEIGKNILDIWHVSIYRGPFIMGKFYTRRCNSKWAYGVYSRHLSATEEPLMLKCPDYQIKLHSDYKNKTQKTKLKTLGVFYMGKCGGSNDYVKKPFVKVSMNNTVINYLWH